MEGLAAAVSAIGALMEAVEWPVARYRFDFEVTASIHLPPYGGSTIRGAFGRALRKTCCMTHMRVCGDCPLYRSCPYVSIFESPKSAEPMLLRMGNVPNPYIIEAPVCGEKVYAPGEHIVFDVVLFGKAIEKLPIIVYALRQAFSRDVGYGRAKLIGVFEEVGLGAEYPLIYAGFGDVAPVGTGKIRLEPIGPDAAIQIETPLRLQSEGRILGAHEFSAYAFFISLLRRVSLLMKLQAAVPVEIPHLEIAEEIAAVTCCSDLSWRNFIRYSSRQKQKMNLAGSVGTVEFHGLSPNLQVLLQLGTWIHAGKNATFGLGKYSLLQ